MKPVTTWVVVSGRLRVYRGRDLVAEFDADQFPEMIVGMAKALRGTSQSVVDQKSQDMRHKACCGSDVIHKDDPSLPLG